MGNRKKETANRVDEARSAAVDLVYAVMENDSYTNLSVDQAFSGKPLSSLDRSFATALSYGTITRIVVLDAILSKYSAKPLDRLDPLVRTLLRVGAWQIFWSDRIPDSAACNESVKLAKRMTNPGAASYVNALLRTLIREKSSILQDFILAPRDFGLRCCLPSELAGSFRKWFGENRTLALCEAMNEPSPATARVNTQRASVVNVRNSLNSSGCTTSDPVFMEDAFSLRTNGSMMEALPAFVQGEFVIQDEAAMLVSVVADPKPGQRVIDLCAAPGGKACHMAGRMQDQGEIIACDINPARLELVRQNAARLGLSILRTLTMDACTITPGIGISDPDGAPSLSQADIVLADVPCSGLGILGKKPDIRIHMTYDKMVSLYPVQEQILENAASLVKPGGFLVYSTCTLNPKENQDRIRQFLDVHPSLFEPVDFSSLLPDRLVELDPSLAGAAAAGMLTLFPDLHHCDGFFIAKLRRKDA